MRRAGSAIGIGLVVLAFVAGCQSLTGTSVGTADDAAVTASVKTRLVADRSANLTRIDIDTNRGTVYLMGSVDTAEQKARAERLAWQATRVKGVVNNLQVVQKR
jgi:hyperosmotically inducible protein